MFVDQRFREEIKSLESLLREEKMNKNTKYSNFSNFLNVWLIAQCINIH